MNALDVSINLAKFGTLPIRMLGDGDITQISKLDRLNQETAELEDCVIIFGSDNPDERTTDYLILDKLQSILEDIEEWQNDDDQVTGIDLLLKIKDEINDLLSLGDTEEVS